MSEDTRAITITTVGALRQMLGGPTDECPVTDASGNSIALQYRSCPEEGGSIIISSKNKNAPEVDEATNEA